MLSPLFQTVTFWKETTMDTVVAILTQDIVYYDLMDRPHVLFKDTIIVVDLKNLVGCLEGVHFTIELQEFRVMN